MAIDFHDPTNRLTYAKRAAGPEWVEAVRDHVHITGPRVVDVGCGGGTYCLAWLSLGATSVVGVDFSQAILRGASERCRDHPGLSWQLADATATGLPDACADIVFQRALLHHLPKPQQAFAEAHRLLAPGGRLLVQDRTMADVSQQGSASHLRGYFFSSFPTLLNVERQRRPHSSEVTEALREAGFGHPTELRLAETRRTYPNRDTVRDDLLARTGRSILHELDDDELAQLAEDVVRALPASGQIEEVDYWTMWIADRDPTHR